MRFVLWAVGSQLLAFVACVGDDPRPGGAPSDAADSGGPDGSTPDASAPPGDATADPALLRAVAVSAGASHTCALLEDGGVACWGSNANGELGLPASSVGASSVPVRVSLPARAVQVTAGDRFTCAALESGKIACWGHNDSGQLGRAPLGAAGEIGEVSEPAPDDRGPWAGPLTLSAGSSHVCAMVPGSYVVAAASEVDYAWCWGKNASRQLLRDTTLAPSAVPLLAVPGDTALPIYASTVVSGADFSCANSLIPDTTGNLGRGIQCWGDSRKNQLGRIVEVANPFLGLPALSGDAYLTNPTFLAAGAAHACAVADARGGGTALYCWGDGSRGAIGTNTSTDTAGVPHTVASTEARALSHLAAGGNLTCVVAAGVLNCMGASQSGQLGDGTVDTNPHPAWSTVDVPPTVTSLAVGGEHVCAVFGGAARQPGAVRCWGANRSGQLGDGLDLNAGYADSPEQKFIRARPVSVRAFQL